MLSDIIKSMLKNVIFSGGVAHDYPKTTSMLVEILAEVGIQSEVQEGFEMAEDGRILDLDLITLNCVRWSTNQTECFHLSEKARAGLLEFLSRGKGLLALHCATICFDDWPEYRKILGAWWKWNHSGHAPHQEQKMRVFQGKHPITEGLADFVIADELYTDPIITDTVDPLIEGEWYARKHPILWVGQYGPARICYNALGHGPEAFANPTNRILLQRGALWVAKQLDAETQR